MDLPGHLAGEGSEINRVASTRRLDDKFFLPLMSDEVVAKLFRVRIHTRPQLVLTRVVPHSAHVRNDLLEA